MRATRQIQFIFVRTPSGKLLRSADFQICRIAEFHSAGGGNFGAHSVCESLRIGHSRLETCATNRGILPSIALVIAGLLLGTPQLTPAQTSNAPATSPRYETRTDHDRDGIGKVYMGREIAQVMGHQAADWLERPEREAEEHPELALPALKIKPGDAVADIGAGSGYYTRRLAKLVGDKGVVYAVDIQQEMLDLLTNKMAEANIHNVKPILGDVTTPKLPRGSVDLALLVDVYHEFDHPYEMIEAICASLKPGGRIAFVEFRGEDPTVPIKALHKMTESQVRKEMSAQPLEWVETSEVLPWQHIIIFRKKNSS